MKYYQFLSLFNILIVFLISSNSSLAQELLDSRTTSYFTYVYRITDVEADELYEKGYGEKSDRFLHTLIDSFPTGSEYNKVLDVGHYIKTYADKNKQYFFMTSVMDFDVMIIDNSLDLAIRVYDHNGNNIHHAKVKAGSKTLQWDYDQQAYVHKHSNKRGVLSVIVDGRTAFYNLERQENNPGIARFYRKVVYETPVKYVWIPVQFIVSIPVDAVRSISYGYPVNSIYRISNFFRRTYYRMGCWLFNEYCYYFDSGFGIKHKSYIVFNKPKYLPGDTVRVKAFIVNKRGRPINDPVKLVLRARTGRVKLANIEPHAPGSFSYDFFLHDSLNLDLNRTYFLHFEKNYDKIYTTGTFRYEDYELSGINLSLRAPQKDHYRNIPFYIFARAADENDLHVLDGRLEITVRPVQVEKFFEEKAFISDVLFFESLPLEYNRETRFQIPDSIFPPINLEYEIGVRLLTASNETFSQTSLHKFFHQKKKIEITPLQDSLSFRVLENGQDINRNIKVSGIDKFGNNLQIAECRSPVKVEISPYFAKYKAESEEIKDSIDASELLSRLRFSFYRTRDSLFLFADNPREIPLSYQIYRRNRQIQSGNAKNLNKQIPVKSKQNHFVNIQYLWRGEIINERYMAPLRENLLNVEIDEPPMIFPGQEVEIKVSVSDFDGRPAAGVDLTAFALTSKFNYKQQQIPYLGKTRKSQRFINRFSISKPLEEDGRWKELDFNVWKELASLDTIEYYRFLYPSPLYRFEYPAIDGITQFAPFVLHEGRFEPINAIYVDNRPVWFSQVTNIQPWSFHISPGKHQIRLRLPDREITLDDINFPEGKKVILSMDKKIVADNVLNIPQSFRISDIEKRNLRNYIFTYRYTGQSPFAWIENNEQVFFLNPRQRQRHMSRQITGPVAGNVIFYSPEKFSLSFNHEPGFEYEFAPSLLKMRSVPEAQLVPGYSPFFHNFGNISQEVYTRDAMYAMYRQIQLDNTRNSLFNLNPRSTSSGNGSLIINIDYDDLCYKPEHLLLIHLEGDFSFNMYPWPTEQIHDLKPGVYLPVFLYENHQQYIAQEITIRGAGINYQTIQKPDTLLTHQPFYTFRALNDVISDIILADYEGRDLPVKEIISVEDVSFPYSGRGHWISGRIFDSQDGLPLPGVTIMVEGTDSGTVSDINGYYSLNMPPGKHRIIVRFIGMIPKELSVFDDDTRNIFLESDFAALEEVVIVGYGVQRSASQAVIIDTENMIEMEMIEDDMIFSQLKGQVTGVQIRGISSPQIQTDQQPLYIIDGRPFLGDVSLLKDLDVVSMEIIDRDASAIYGSRAATGVILISTRSGFQVSADLDDDAVSFEIPDFAGASGTLRTNFSDYAFWQPRLMTDKNGEASFNVVFPDDITRWDTHYLAMNGKRQSGQTSSNIRSYLPLSAQLALPRFLVESDTTYAIGKVFNYLGDSTEVDARFLVDDTEIFHKQHQFVKTVIDTLQIVALTADSINITYSIQREDGYYDGEQRKVPVFQKGLEEVIGSFHVLDRDTTIELKFDSKKGDLHLYARADMIDVMEEEIEHVLRFRYYCNEQIASRLKALFALKSIYEHQGRKFEKDREINRLINRLNRSQRRSGMWGWWSDSDASAWISLHVLEAFELASRNGYDTGLDLDAITPYWVWELENSANIDIRLQTLKILNKLNAVVDYPRYISMIEKADTLTFNQYLHLLHLKQLCGFDYSLDTLSHYRNETLFGNAYFSDGEKEFSLLNNDIQNTLIAYKLIEKDSLYSDTELISIRNYLLELRQNGFWRNTYESARIIETILPAMSSKYPESPQPELIIQGDYNQVIKEFPFQRVIKDISNLRVINIGNNPIYFTAYQIYQNKEPDFVSNEFSVRSQFNNSDSIAFFKAGEEIKLSVNVQLEKDAEYVMIIIPIPAGCSYSDMRNFYRYEDHREYFRNEVVIFCERLPEGEHNFDVDLIARYAGTYNLNPAQIKLMYYPVFTANERMKTVIIK